jgi:hypothetical protein
MNPKCLTLALASFLSFPFTVLATNAPSNLAATGTSSSQVNLTWTDNSTDETGFTFAYDTNSGLTSPTYVYAGGVNTTSYSHTGRSAATTYYYKIKAEGNPDSTWTAVDSATTAPSGLSATATSNTTIQLTWTGNASNTAITGYTYAYADNSSFTGATYKFVAGSGSTSASQAGLAAGTTYWFKIKAEGTSDSLDSPYGTVVSATTTSTSQPAISPHFAGINAWMPYQIGSNVYNGKLETKWIEVEESGAKIMRYGGNGVDQHANPSSSTVLDQYLDMVDAMRSRGIEPVLQVPVYDWTYSASQAASLVQYINITHSRGVKYWSIGNEPDLQSGVYQYTSASQVAAYIKPFASAMKQVDPTIKILAPETAWYNETIINGLTSCTGNSTTDAHSIAGKDSNGHYYVDIISFHIYGFDGTQSRSGVISKLTSPGGFNDDLSALKDRIDDCNALHNRTGSNALKIAVTEANVNYEQPANDGVTVNGADGVGAASFLGGQFWAELMGIAMQQGVDFVSFWSVIEGGSSHPTTEIGYLSGDGFTFRPLYYHFQMMAENFRGNSVTATELQTNVKTFAAKDVDQIAVMIMNQETSTSFNYTVRLNNGTVSGSNPLKINVDAGVAAEYNGILGPESSLLLVFNSSGAIKKKIEYTRTGHAVPEDPPSVTTYP